jgi:hypothetical protein
MAFEIKQPKEPKRSEEANLLKMDYPSWGIEQTKEKKKDKETSLLSMDYPSWDIDRPEKKEQKQNMTPLYNIDMSKYPQKDRLKIAIEKTNELFQERSEIYIFDEIRTSNIEAFINSDGTKNWQKIYEYYMDIYYKDPEATI